MNAVNFILIATFTAHLYLSPYMLYFAAAFFPNFLTSYLVSFLLGFHFCPVFPFSLVLILFAYPLSFFSLSLSSLDMLAMYSIIQDLIKCDIKKVTLRNERLFSVRRNAASVLLRMLQGFVPAVEDEGGDHV